MGTAGNPFDKKRDPKAFNLTLAAVTGQVGCLTLLIILLALFGGMWLDNHFATTGPIFTIGLMIGSVPITLVLMFWIVRATTARMMAMDKKTEEMEEDEGARDS